MAENNHNDDVIKKVCAFDTCPYHRDHANRIKSLEGSSEMRWHAINRKVSLTIFMWVVGLLIGIGFTYANIQSGTQQQILTDVIKIKEDIAVIKAVTVPKNQRMEGK